jgi:hypothetical protein
MHKTALRESGKPYLHTVKVATFTHESRMVKVRTTYFNITCPALCIDGFLMILRANSYYILERC